MTKAERSAKALREREESALEELKQLGWFVLVYQPCEPVAADPLRGVEAHTKPGVCDVVLYSTNGKRKSLSSISAVQTLDEALSWHTGQERLKPAFRFPIAARPVPIPVFAQAAGDTRETQIRRENTERRRVSFEGVPHLVPYGDPA